LWALPGTPSASQGNQGTKSILTSLTLKIRLTSVFHIKQWHYGTQGIVVAAQISFYLATHATVRGKNTGRDVRMASAKGDYQDLVAHRRFLDELEHGIRMVNREIIHEKLPEITKDHFLKFAVLTSRVRASYLAAAFELVETNSSGPSEDVLRELKIKREMYEEAVEAFESLKRAIERGYVDVASESPAE
jgi:hypothetical protein